MLFDHFIHRLTRRALLPIATFVLSTPVLATPLLVNGGFEAGNINWNGAWGAYCYSSVNCSATGWSGSYLLTSVGAWAWGYPNSRPGFDAATQGLVVAGLQTTEHLQQTLHLAQDGQYTLTWRDAGRPTNGYTYYDQTYTISVDGNGLGSYHTVQGQAWTDHTLTLDLLAGDRVLNFQGLQNQLDGTAFLDNLSLTLLTGSGAGANGGSTTNIPEPASLALIALSLAGIGFARRHRKQQAA